ncbi:MAG: hypothetical protein U9P79_09725 [Candidatus Cloacimonadota bacterium]|nr:hypothetical protein [Candidatus Cloacimonadota bacterium]
MLEKKVSEFLSNRASGAEELAKQELEIISAMLSAGYDENKIRSFILAGSDKFSEMTPLQKIFNFFSENEINIETLQGIKTKILNYDYIKNSEFLFKEDVGILTFSNSSSVYNVINEYKEKVLQVYCCRSLPLGEGEICMENLRKAGIDSQLIEDSEFSQYVKKVNFVLIGADAVYEDFFINKTGTFQIAYLSKYFKTPVYVVAAKSKFADSNSFDESKIGKYFEKVERDLVTEILF